MKEKLKNEEVSPPMSHFLNALRHRPDIDMSSIAIRYRFMPVSVVIYSFGEQHKSTPTAKPYDTKDIGEHLSIMYQPTSHKIILLAKDCDDSHSPLQ